ncbi:MAG: CoA transferase [SAR202 cluster bacterium]|jgi:crotonobetainyl-CoA:carnitine CoA-transferase CaiB-like acyl-CoA transferase|nr:CoA transferase [SAR202 cluster bacterium]MDP6716015.1 CoA transferase [SAR202 cluster bacterium]
MDLNSNGPLAGIRVIDLAGEPGLFVGRQLGELGADVIRVEPPEGDSSRLRQPFLEGEAGIERSLYHLHFNANKRGVTFDIHSPEGQEKLRRLVQSSDVLIETAAPGEMDEMGVGYDDLRTLNPGLLYATVTPFGQKGPMRHYRGNDLICVATSGLMYINGFPEDPPNQPGAEQAYHMASVAAVAGTLTALVARDRDPNRRGTRIDVSIQEAASMATIQTANANIYTWHGQIPQRIGLMTMAGGRSLFLCRDGRWISFTVPLGTPPLWAAFVEWLREEGLDGPLSGDNWLDAAYRTEHIGLITDAIVELTSRHDRAYIFHEGQRRRMLTMAVNDARDLLEDEHLQQRDFFATTDNPDLGQSHTDVGPPYRFSETPTASRRPAPTLGEHNQEILDQLEACKPDKSPKTPVVARRSLPLEGIRVADFGWMIAGPATSRILADFGAEVIKIESQARLDNIRAVGIQPPGPSTIDTNAVFNDCNTSKHSITLNMNSPSAIELVKKIVRQSDIVTNNFTPERMPRWGLGYDELRSVKPDIIMLNMPVMGSSGPYKGYGSYGNGVIAYSGLSMSMGLPDKPPTGMAALYSDFSAPYFGVSAMMAALHHRDRTGEGQFIDLSQSETTINLLGTDILEYTANGILPPMPGNRSRKYCPHGAYPCAGDDRWCAIAVANDEDWNRLCNAIGRPELATDARFATDAARREHEDELDELISTWTRQRDAWDVMRTLQSQGVMAGVVSDLEDMNVRDPWLPGNHLIPLIRDGEDVTFTTHAQPAHLEGVSPTHRRAPRMGEHNAEVFKDLLGISDDEFVRLLVDEAIY